MAYTERKESNTPVTSNRQSLILTSQLQKAADILKTVAHPVRLQIIDLLERGERSVNEICQRLGTQQPYTSQQLNLMKSRGILSSRREGNQVFYAVANPSVVKMIHCVRHQSGEQQNQNDHCASQFDGSSAKEEKR